jgi:NAD(P)-dependent dehydrogenase (short-subunit alcohol dehydrogenase family)
MVDRAAPFRGLYTVVTGGTGGMGRALCRRLIEAGGHVVGTGSTPAEVEDAQSEAALRGVDWRVLDVTRGEEVRELFSSFDRLDILVNFAGIGRDPSEYEEGGFIHTVDVNLFGTMRTCYAARPHLERSRGAIVNTGSMMSIFGSGGAPAYAASKGGVAQFTKSIAIAWGPLGIRVNALAPGWIETPMTVGIVDDRARARAVLARTPLGRWGDPDDIAEAALFLASPLSSFVTGVLLPVDGGFSVDGSPHAPTTPIPTE